MHPDNTGSMLTDTHCHLDFESFDGDRGEVLRRAEQAGIRQILIPGLTVDSSRGATRMAESHPALHAAVGIHPTEGDSFTIDSMEKLRELAGAAKVRAIGEIGLDYYWKGTPHEKQLEMLKAQLALAAETGLPVVIHFREKGDQLDGPCAADLLGTLDEWVRGLRETGNPLAERPGVLHSFSGTEASAQRVIGLGFFLGVTGAVTYSKRRQELVAHIGLEHLLVETDSPFLPPAEKRGERNEPANILLIADTIVRLKRCNLEDVARATSANAGRLFQWED